MSKAQLIEGITLAWMNAYFQRVEKMPSLKEAIDDVFPSEDITNEGMSEDAMLNMAKMLNARFGGKVVEGKETTIE